MTDKNKSSQTNLTPKSKRTDHELAMRMRKLREEWGESQRGMAKLLKCTLNTWQSYESGNVFPSPKILRQLHDRGIDANWVLTGNGIKPWEINIDCQTIQKIHKSMSGQTVASEGARCPWPFPWPYHPQLFQAVIETIEEIVMENNLEGRIPARKKARTIMWIYEMLIPDYADGRKEVVEGDGVFDGTRFGEIIKLIAS